MSEEHASEQVSRRTQWLMPEEASHTPKMHETRQPWTVRDSPSS